MYDATHHGTKNGPAEKLDRPESIAETSCDRLALGELRRATGLLEAALLALDDAGVAGEETSALEVGTVVASLEKSAGDTQTQGAGLTGDAATIAQGDDVEGTEGVGHLERGEGILNELMTAEVLLGVTLVDGHLTGAGDDTDTSNGILATAGAVVNNGVLSHLLASSSILTGF